jgi:DNA-directed RNA polymerase subunit K/omega
MGAFEFVVLAALRAAQLTRGCVPRINGHHKPAITAQLEIAEGKVTQATVVPTIAPLAALEEIGATT